MGITAQQDDGDVRYIEFFSAVRSSLTAAYGDIGNVHTFLTDFEMVAMKAIGHVFPETRIKGCSFHLRQAMMRRVQLIGLRPQYEDEESPVRGWIRKVLAMSMLPASHVDMAWSFLKIPPVIDDPDVCTKMQTFATSRRRGSRETFRQQRGRTLIILAPRQPIWPRGSITA